ncbi:unnamed protein product [Larinioides sclopetarius]|uniref:Uncharacterized protein n=1 Tax=Larinioides sclopetarius TaxID=280406 RepID=A0AAV1ZED9_9ARAC
MKNVTFLIMKGQLRGDNLISGQQPTNVFPSVIYGGFCSPIYPLRAPVEDKPTNVENHGSMQFVHRPFCRPSSPQVRASSAGHTFCVSFCAQGWRPAVSTATCPLSQYDAYRKGPLRQTFPLQFQPNPCQHSDSALSSGPPTWLGLFCVQTIDNHLSSIPSPRIHHSRTCLGLSPRSATKLKQNSSSNLVVKYRTRIACQDLGLETVTWWGPSPGRFLENQVINQMDRMFAAIFRHSFRKTGISCMTEDLKSFWCPTFPMPPSRASSSFDDHPVTSQPAPGNLKQR